MRVLALFAVLFALLLPIHGQEKTSHTQAQKSVPRDSHKPELPPAMVVWNVINQETTEGQSNNSKEHPKGYFTRLFSPENLPNIGLCIVGFIGIGTAICTLRKIERQTEATEKSLIFQFRPKIIIRGGGVVMQDADSGVIEFAIVNIGSHKAHIVGINLSAKLIESVSTESFLSSAFPISKDELKPGEGTFQTFKLDRTTSNAVHWINQQQKGVNHNKAVVFGGYINYRDDAGTLRNTGIFREYDPTKLRFIAKDDPDLEYAD